ncbi:MAG: serine protease, partial [Acidobacteriota bacterium]
MGITQRLQLKFVWWWVAISFVTVVAAGADREAPEVQWPRIIGGEEAGAGEFPWIVALAYKQSGPVNSSYCGGALIAPDWVITAAHCVRGRSPSSLEAIIGRQLLKSEEEGERRAILQIIDHPDFNTDDKGSDIALLRLESESQTETLNYSTAEVDPAVEGVLATVIGWGRTSPTVAGYPDTLQKVEVPVVSNEVCNGESAYNGAVSEAMLCAGLEEGGKDACTGDSGGPLVVPVEGAWHLAGITSWGEGCAEPNKYGVYTRVFAFRSWIEESMLLPAPNRNPVADAGR